MFVWSDKNQDQPAPCHLLFDCWLDGPYVEPAVIVSHDTDKTLLNYESVEYKKFSVTTKCPYDYEKP